MGYNAKVSLHSGHNLQTIDYTPAGAVAAGDIVIINGIVYFAPADIAAGALGSLVFSGGVWKGNEVDSITFAVGDSVYWNATASPKVGTASTGAFTNVAAGATHVGYAVAATVSGDQFVYFVKGGNGSPRINTASVAATGSVQGDAAALIEGFNLVTAADATKGVILPVAKQGMVVYVKNGDAANAVLKVYGQTGGIINALSANAAISLAAKVPAIFIATSSTQWYTIPLLPS